MMKKERDTVSGIMKCYYKRIKINDTTNVRDKFIDNVLDLRTIIHPHI